MLSFNVVEARFANVVEREHDFGCVERVNVDNG